ncbi:Arginine exporter protein ArgO [Micromonospora purpureochromogenes]|uniref:Arginine exporter protein ArgO n=1 Tax=Micromonospora purpureochromogenes TaxID=47872 RepID=A0A1C4XE79_9ACTN|nr:LysE family transporter [Micromonospora purpureochromogenes]SCF06431.1 Arginine exporter protein ArgO [Micromonospora purpureochromogenes]
MGDALLAGLLAGYGVAVPVGAIAIVVIGLTARTSLRVGAAAALGVAAADGLYAALAVLGGAALAGLVRPVATPLRWSAVVILLFLAGQLAVGALRRHRRPAGPARAERGLATPGRAFAGLLALTLLNPMTIVYFVALVIGRHASGGWTPAGQVAFVAAAFAASASWQLLVAGGGSLLGRLLTSDRGRLVTALLASALIVLLALRMLW